MYAAHSLPLGSEIIIEVSAMDVVLVMVVRTERGAEIGKVEGYVWSEKQPGVRDEREQETEETCGSIAQKSCRYVWMASRWVTLGFPRRRSAMPKFRNIEEQDQRHLPNVNWRPSACI